METKQQDYVVVAKMSVEINGKTMTMQKAAQFLKSMTELKEKRFM